MEAPRRWIAYDTFKLIVALVLLLIFLILLLQRPALPPAPAASQANLAAAATDTLAAPAPATAAPLATATATSLPASPPTQSATAAPTSAPTSAPENTPVPTSAPENTATPTPEATSAAAVTAGCKPPAPARLAIGKTARILSNLNLRSEPKIDNNILSVNPAGAILKVLQGPLCVPYQSSAYLWWQVEAPDGKTGWSAENYLNGQGYYLIPVP